MLKFDIGHYAVLVATILGVIGPDALAHIAPSTQGTTSQVVGALLIVLSAVAALLKASVIPSINVQAAVDHAAKGGK